MFHFFFIKLHFWNSQFLNTILSNKGENISAANLLKVYRKLFGTLGSDAPVFVCQSSALQPKSRGTVTLKSLNPFEDPEIDTNYLEDSRDLDVIVDGK